MNPYALLLVCACVLMVLYGTFAKGKQREVSAAWYVVVGLVGIVVVLRVFEIVNYFHIWMIYGLMVTLNYAITFYIAVFRYKDPARHEHREYANSILKTKRFKVCYVIPVFNEPTFVLRCVSSIIEAANYAKQFGIETEIKVVNDASTDNTWEVVSRHFLDEKLVTLVNLSKNAGKKGALTIGMLGGERWREAYREFKRKYGRHVESSDSEELLRILRSHGCNPPDPDFFLHTDSDSVIDREFIYNQVVAFISNPKIGAVSGHCDVWIDPDEPQTLVTKMQVAWYFTQFRIRKAAEGNSVFCVSGPGAGFRAIAIYPCLLWWVDDWYAGRIYKGATDRRLTYWLLVFGWWVVYSYVARSYTVVPKNLTELRAQWTRWKQNFWRMLRPVWRYAWKAPLSVAYLTYSRLLVTVFAPFIMIEHVSAILLGDFLGSVVYLSGLMAMGSIMGVAYVSFNPDKWRYAMLRPLLSVVSAIWGSSLTLRAFYLDQKRTFTWREAKKATGKGRFINRWFTPTFETRLFTWIVFFISLIWVFRFLSRM